MTMAQQDEAARHFQKPPYGATGFYEVVRTETVGGDFREAGVRQETIVSVHSSELAAMKSVIPKNITIRPLTVQS